MNASLVLSALLFAATVAVAAHLTARERGPFAYVLARLHADRDAFLSVATMLWAVVAGLLALPLLDYVWPNQTATWGSVGFILLSLLANAVRSVLSQRAA